MPSRISATKVGLLLTLVVVVLLGISMRHRRADPATPGGAAPVATAASPAPALHAAAPPIPTAAPTAATTAASSPPKPPPPSARRTALILPAPGVSPASVTVVPPPVGDPSPQELSSPTTATTAWAARWCPFSFHDPLGASETRARAAMTPNGWASFDPHTDPAATTTWAQTVATGSTGVCAAPQAAISPEAPHSPTAAYVAVSIRRIVTPATGAAQVETVRDMRLVLFRDGHWMVDTSAEGAG